MNHKARQLILHFGFPKTGTSALQRTLFSQRDRLLESHDTLYPGGFENHFYLRALFAGRPESLFQIQMLGLGDRDAISEFLESYRQDLLTDINITRPNRIVISSEDFITMPVNELAMLHLFAKTIAEDVVLFAYVRDPWGESISLLQEQILTGYVAKEAKFTYTNSPAQTISRFEEAFGVQANIAPYVKKTADFNVAVDFCHRFDFEDLIPAARGHTNVRSSMGRESTCVLLQLNQLYPVFDENNDFISDPVRDLMRETISNSQQSRTSLRISTSTAKEIYENSLADIQYLEERYFDGRNFFTEHYNTLQTTDFDDTLSIATFEPEQLSDFFLSCMYELALYAIEGDRSAQELKRMKNSRLWKFVSFLQKIIQRSRHFLLPWMSHSESTLQKVKGMNQTVLKNIRKN
jgi:hypothetical protein